MKQLFSYILVAVVSSCLTFFLVLHFYEPALVEPAEKAFAVSRSVDYGVAVPVNSRPAMGQAIASDNFVDISRTVTDAVVNITVFKDGRPISNGSGVVYSGGGYIITNHHVVTEGHRFEVTLSDKRRHSARVIGSDPTTDIALLKIEATDLHPLRFGNSDALQVGEWVLAVGNPFNLTSTVTAGIVSAKGRNLDIIDDSYSIEAFIQTDAVVNPGNSGGALINTRGELIGINSAILSESGAYEGYSFAIPGNLVRKVVEDLQLYGYVQRAILGIAIRELDDRNDTELGLRSLEGALVSSVNPGSSAARAGLSPGDVIVAINGFRIRTVPELQEIVARFRPGDRVSLDFFRKGHRLRLESVELQGLRNQGFSGY